MTFGCSGPTSVIFVPYFSCVCPYFCWYCPYFGCGVHIFVVFFPMPVLLLLYVAFDTAFDGLCLYIFKLWMSPNFYCICLYFYCLCHYRIYCLLWCLYSCRSLFIYDFFLQMLCLSQIDIPVVFIPIYVCCVLWFPY